MYCPNCAAEENQPKQFCRNCGTDLRGVRSALLKPDSVTASAASARDEIGRAVAFKIKELESGYDLKKVAEDVLPQIEKFLESPEERRLRSIRSGVITSAVGLGAMLLFGLVSMMLDKELIIMALAGIVPFLIGLGLIINGRFFTIPRQHFSNAANNLLEQAANNSVVKTNELLPAEGVAPPSSVVEHTTHRLPETLKH